MWPCRSWCHVNSQSFNRCYPCKLKIFFYPCLIDISALRLITLKPSLIVHPYYVSFWLSFFICNSTIKYLFFLFIYYITPHRWMTRTPALHNHMTNRLLCLLSRNIKSPLVQRERVIKVHRRTEWTWSIQLLSF